MRHRSLGTQSRRALTTAVGPLVEGMERRTLLSAGSPLTGTVIGTPGSYQNAGNTVAKAFDGSVNTYVDAAAASGSYAGLDLGTPQVLNQVSFAPRAGFAGRMVGGVFQGSNDPTFASATTLDTVTATPAVGTLTSAAVNPGGAAFRYVRYVGPAGSYGNIAEAQFFAAPPAAGATLANGVLTVTGSAGADTINVTVLQSVGGSAGTTVTVNGQTQTFDADPTNALQRIAVDAGDGNDQVTVAVAGAVSHPAVSVAGGAGDDTLAYDGDIAAVVDGGADDDRLTEASGPDQNAPDGVVTLLGGDGNDAMESQYNGGVVLMNGGAGDDRFTNADATDFDDSIIVIGGSGIDTVDVSQSTLEAQSLTISMNAPVTTTTGTGGTPYYLATDVENLVGTLSGTRQLTVLGNALDNHISAYADYGGTGQTSLSGGGGNDVLTAVAGNTTLDGGDGNDTLVQSTPATTVADGGAGDDTLVGLPLNNTTADGGAGNDTIDASAYTVGVTIDLAKYTSFENAVGGSGNDVIYGTSADNVLTGNGGDDVLVARGGADVLNGGDGNDTAYADDGGRSTVDGGPGTDTAYVDPTGDATANVESVVRRQGGVVFPTPKATQLTGTVFGTPGSYNNAGNTVAKAVDGNVGTFFDAPSANGATVGIALASARTVTQIRFAPRAGYAGRMVGGTFQAADDATFTTGVVTAYRVAAAPAVGTLTTVNVSVGSHRFWRYVAPDGSYGNIAEFQLFGV